MFKKILDIFVYYKDSFFDDNCCTENNENYELLNFIYKFGLNSGNIPLKKLQLSYNEMIISCYKIDCSNRNIKTIPNIEILDNLHELNCSHNNINNLPQLPLNIKIIDCSYNSIEKLPYIPYGVEVFICSNNRIRELVKLPITIKYLACDGNPIKMVHNSQTFFDNLNLLIKSSYCNFNYI